MYPVLLHAEPIIIYSLWIFAGIGFFTILLFINSLTNHRKIKLSFLANNSLFILLSAIVCSRLFFIIENFEYFIFSFNPLKILEFFYIWDKGLSTWGAVFGTFACLYYLCKKDNIDFFAWSDILITSLFFGMFFFNIGAFFDGRNYGTPTDFSWGVMIESSEFAVPIHPTQIYAAIYALLIGLLLMILFNNEKLKDDGKISLLGIILYSTFRFIEEFLRADGIIIFQIINLAHIICLIVIITASKYLYEKIKKIDKTNT